jgi:hypothetical protein
VHQTCRRPSSPALPSARPSPKRGGRLEVSRRLSKGRRLRRGLRPAPGSVRGTAFPGRTAGNPSPGWERGRGEGPPLIAQAQRHRLALTCNSTPSSGASRHLLPSGRRKEGARFPVFPGRPEAEPGTHDRASAPGSSEARIVVTPSWAPGSRCARPGMTSGKTYPRPFGACVNSPRPSPIRGGRPEVCQRLGEGRRLRAGVTPRSREVLGHRPGGNTAPVRGARWKAGPARVLRERTRLSPQENWPPGPHRPNRPAR